MTIDETIDLIAVVRMLWPHSDLGEPRHQAVVWGDFLRPYRKDEVEAAVRRLASAGREHAPPVGVIVREVERRRQTDPPSFDDMQIFVARHQSCLPYGQTNTPEDTVEAIEKLTAAGAHEAVLRFVASHGVFAVRMMPDPSRDPLDRNQHADRRDMARDYRGRILSDWEGDPRAGLAFERACRSVGIDPATRPQVTAPAPDELRARRERRRLAAPQVEPESEVADGEMVDFDFEATWAAVKAERARNRELRERAALDARRLRDREDAERREALEELAAHAARRDGTGQDAG